MKDEGGLVENDVGGVEQLLIDTSLLIFEFEF